VSFQIYEQDLGVIIPTLIQSGPGADILLLTSGTNFDPLRSTLLGFPEINQVNTYNVTYGNPSLETLLEHDVVIYWRAYSSLGDQEGLGNLLADYVDAGGKVIQATFNWTYSSNEIGGRFIDGGYSPFVTEESGNHYSYANLGVHDPNHPLMENVTGLSAYSRDYVQLSPAADLVAAWDDGEELAAVKDSVVAINSYPSPNGGWDGDLPQLIYNAIQYLTGFWDVIWLSQSPESETVEVGESQQVSVTFDASVVDQPGQYTANLWVKSPTPIDSNIQIPVTMTVEIPVGWGKIEGTISSLGYCDSNPGPLNIAQILIQDSLGQSWTVSTDLSGYFKWWADSAGSPYTVTASHDQHFSAQSGEVWVSPQEPVQVSLDLRWVMPCLSTLPEDFHVTSELGSSLTLPITLTNQGAGDALFTIFERNHFSRLPGTASLSDLEELAAAENGGISVLLLTSSYDYNLLKSTLESTSGIQEVIIYNPNYLVPSLEYLLEFDVVITWGWYYWGVRDALGNVLADYLDREGALIQTANNWAFQDYQPGGRFLNQGYSPLTSLNWGGYYGTSALVPSVPGHYLMYGVLYAGTSYHDYVELNGNAESIALWSSEYQAVALKDNVVGINAPPAGSGGYPAPANGWDGDLGKIFVNAVKYLAYGKDILWLSADPSNGTVLADSAAQVSLTFDAGAVSQPGEYYGSLLVQSDDPVNSMLSVPLTFTVTPPDSWGVLQGAVSGHQHCNQGDPLPLQFADVTAAAQSGQSWTVQTSSDGSYTLWLPADGSPYTIQFASGGYKPAEAGEVLIEPQQTSLLDMELDLLAPCFAVSPPALEATLALGQAESLTLTLSNLGVGEGVFTIQEVAAEPKAVSSPPDVLLLASDWYWYPVYDYLSMHPDIGEVGMYEFTYSLPDLSLLQQYDLVLFWQSNYFYDMESLGNLLADYLDWGGKLVMAGSNWEYLYLRPEGRFAEEGLDPLISDDYGSSYSYWSLAAYDMNHPIMANVSPFFQTYNSTYVTPTPGAYVVAAFSSGEEFIAEKGSVVSINAFATDATGWIDNQLGLIFANTILYLTQVDIPWLSADPVNGTVSGGSEQEIYVTLDAGQVQEIGEYQASLLVSTSDTLHPIIEIPVSLHVVMPSYSFELDPRSASGTGAPGDSVAYTFTITNTANLPDTVLLGGAAGWNVLLPGQIGPLNHGESAAFQVHVEIPLSALAGEADQLLLTAASLGDPSQVFTASLTTTASSRFGLQLSPLQAAKAANPGSAAVYDLTLTNTGNISDTFDLHAAGEWELSYPSEIGPLSPGESQAFTLSVQVPENALAGDSDEASLAVSSRAAPQQSQSALLTTTASLVRAIRLEPPSAAGAAEPGLSAAYALTVTNKGSAIDSFSISAGASPWGSDFPIDLLPLGPGESETFTVTVFVPTNAAIGSSQKLVITVHSQSEPAVKASTELITTAAPRHEWTINAGVTAQSGRPGQKVGYVLQVANTGTAAEVFHIDLSGNAWDSALSVDSFTLLPGASRQVLLEVSIPLEAEKGSFDRVTLAVTVESEQPVIPPLTFTTSVLSDYMLYLPITLR
jgi:uncharacterized membrane protein